MTEKIVKNHKKMWNSVDSQTIRYEESVEKVVKVLFFVKISTSNK